MEIEKQSQLKGQIFKDHPYLDVDCNEEYHSAQMCGEVTTILSSLPSRKYKPNEFDINIPSMVLIDNVFASTSVM